MGLEVNATKRPGFLISRDFGLLWFGQTISLVGDIVFSLTLIVWIAADLARQANGQPQPWAPLAVSGAAIAETAPILLLGPIAGVFVDRWEKKPVLLRVDAARAILIALLLPATGIIALPFLGGAVPLGVRLGAIYVVVFLASCAAQFFNGSRFALIGDVVAEPYRPQASGLSQASRALATVIGPPLAAPLLFSFGIQWALIINALSFVVSFVCVALTRVPPATRSLRAGQRGDFRREFMEGVRFVTGNRILRAALFAIFIISLGAGSLEVLGVFFITERLGLPAESLGYAAGIFGAGILVGAIIGGPLARRIGLLRAFVFALMVSGIFLVILSRLLDPHIAIVFLIGVGISQAFVNLAITPIFLAVTPKELVGRASAVLDPVGTVAALISVALAGYLASTVLVGFHARWLGLSFGPVDTIYTGAGALFLLGGIVTALALRGARLPEAAATPATVVATDSADGDAPAR